MLLRRIIPVVGSVLVGVSTLLLTVVMVQAMATAPAAQTDLRLNEFMASNATILEDPDEPGEFPDWIELYNPGLTAVSLNGLALTDDPGDPTKFPITDGVTIPAQGFLVFFADNDPKQGPLHTNFALSAGGESIALYRIQDGKLIDQYTFGPQTTDISEGRRPDGSGAWQTFAAPTPNKSNQTDPPIISGMGHSPALPAAGASVIVTAAVTDNGSLTSVTLLYSTTSSSLIGLPMSKGAGNVYQATIPGQAAGVLVNYFVRAVDNQNNTSETRRKAYVSGYVAPPLAINEIMFDNSGLFEDPDEPGEFPDWIEIVNLSNQPVSLNGLSLSDNPREPDRYLIPPGVVVAARGYVVFWADNDPKQGPLHTNFALNKDGEFLGLFGGFATVQIDAVDDVDLIGSPNLGRLPNVVGTWTPLYCASPGKTNFACNLHTYLPTLGR